MPELTTIVFCVTKILSTVAVDIPVHRIVPSYQNKANFKNWPSCSFQSKHMEDVKLLVN